MKTVRYWIGEGARLAGFPERNIASGLDKADESTGAMLEVRRLVPDEIGIRIRDANAEHLREPTPASLMKMMNAYAAAVHFIAKEQGKS